MYSIARVSKRLSVGQPLAYARGTVRMWQTTAAIFASWRTS